MEATTKRHSSATISIRPEKRIKGKSPHGFSLYACWIYPAVMLPQTQMTDKRRNGEKHIYHCILIRRIYFTYFT
jgi:hypothetical protein